MSDSTIGKPLREASIDSVSRGFRTSFRFWCSDKLVPRKLAERALAHTVRDSTERAYVQFDILDLGSSLMTDWAKYIGG